jgi:predicted nucleic acid-binding protein
VVNLRFLLDTNTISELSRLQPNSSIATRYTQNIDEIAISSVTWHEGRYDKIRSVRGFQIYGRYWIRTSDPFRVKEKR